jgi:DNA-binding response OmpR family regulator
MIATAMSRPAAKSTTPRAWVLVVDDEPTIGEIVARYLVRAGYSAQVASDGPQALDLVARQPPDLVVLDVMLPGIDGLEVLRRLRESEDPPRVILLTARGREAERVVGLRRGADDYVVKPFSPAELVARVEAVLRRTSEREARDQTGGASQATPAIELDGLRIEPATRRVVALDSHDGRGTGHEVIEREVTLTAREFDLLAFLARHPGQVFSRDRLMELVWQLPDYSDSSTVTVHIRRLRAKIEPDSEHPRYVQTVWGVGYRFQS